MSERRAALGGLLMLAAGVLLAALALLWVFQDRVADEPLVDQQRPTARSNLHLAAREKAVRKQEDRLEEKRRALDTIVERKGIVYRGGDSVYRTPSAPASGSGHSMVVDGEVKVGGYVRKPGAVKVCDGMTLGEVLESANGANEFGAVNRMQVFRGGKRMLLDLRSEEGRAFRIRPGDSINVPQKNWLGNGGGHKHETDVPAVAFAAGDRVGPGRRSRGELNEAMDLMVEVPALSQSFSTFSLHVSDSSFRVAAAALGRGERPDPEAIRTEEFYNAFDYGDPAPTAGSPVSCAIEQCAHPLLPGRNLVRIGVRTAAEGRGDSQALRLTVLLDSSGSMEREDRRAAVLAAVEQLASLLGPQDLITVIGFSRRPRLLVEGMDGDAAQRRLAGLVRDTPAEGGTNLEWALEVAGELAARQFDAAAQNRIVLLTDGAANLGNADPEELAKRVEGLRQRGVSFDAAGFGTAGMNDRMLERLTRDGNGRYYVVDGPEDADESFARKLAGAFRPAAENVKVQVRFNPGRVSSYRLIGFEEHRLKKEDFRDDRVDAAEMASEEAGVAVYQVGLLPDGEGEIGEVSVRFRDAARGSMVEHSWTMPHDASAPAFDRASGSMQVAGLAVMAADELRSGPLAPLIDWRDLAPVTTQVRVEFAGSVMVGELLRMVERLR